MTEIAILTGQKVIFRPTQGAYQKEMSGIVLAETPKQVVVRVDGKRTEIRFHKSSGLPVNKHDQEFPCYQVVFASGESEGKTD